MNKGRRIVFDDEGFIAEGENVALDIASEGSDYSERVELVNMPADLRESLKANRVSFDQIAASGYVTKIYEAISREFPEGIDVPSLYVAAVGVKGTVTPPMTWDGVERFMQKMTQHCLNLFGLWQKALGLDPNGEFENLPEVPLGLRLKRGFPPGDTTTPESADGHSERYMEIIEEQLKPLAARESYIVLDGIMSVMANRMGFGNEFRAEVERWLGEVAKPKPTGLVGFFGLE
jgi:hypothetical protein